MSVEDSMITNARDLFSFGLLLLKQAHGEFHEDMTSLDRLSHGDRLNVVNMKRC